MSKKLRDNYNVRIKQPIDTRFSVNNLSDIDRPYDGLITYCNGTYYKYENSSFKEINFNDTISVKNFGALGDGTNQTTQFQNTINSLPLTGDFVIHVPYGSYTIDTVNVGDRKIIWDCESGSNIIGTLDGVIKQPNRGIKYSFPSDGGWRLELDKTDTPLPYYLGTQAIMVVQNKDTTNLGENEFSSGIQFDFVTDADGYVVSDSRYSGSIWQGLQSTQDKKGDGSAHVYSALGQLKETGVGGYNELGLFQGMATNINSAKGTLSGCEIILQDGTSPTDNRATAMSVFLARINRTNNGVQPANAFLASSEGTQPCTSILTTNTQGFNQWENGLNIGEAIFTTGRAIILPNQSFITAWNEAKTEMSFILGSGANDDTILSAVSDVGGITLTNKSGTTLASFDNDSLNPCILRINGFSSRITVGAVDSGGSGYRMVRVAN